MSEVPEKRDDSAEIEQQDEGPKRFLAKGPIVHDTETDIYWMKKDSWQDKSKFFNWHESRDYAENKNMRSIGGFDDWRLPVAEEVKTLFLKEQENPGKGGVALHLDKIFPEGAFKTCWIAGDTSTRRPRFDFVDGKLVWAEEYAFGSVRLCRKGPIKKIPRRTQRRR